jgi:hypothetical protein
VVPRDLLPDLGDPALDFLAAQQHFHGKTPSLCVPTAL